MTTNAEKDLVLRLEILAELIKEAEELTAQADPSTRGLRIAIAQLTDALPSIEKYKPKQQDTNDPNKYTETAARPVIRAHTLISRLQATLDDIEAEVGKKVTEVKVERTPYTPSLIKSLDIKIPIFNGDHSEYPTFKETFEIATNPLSPPQKLAILRQHLEKSILTSIKSFPLTDEGYAKAMAKLDENYLIENRIKHQLREKLRLMPSATDETNSLRKTYEAIEALLTSLEQYETTESVNNNETYRCTVMSKYPRPILHELAPGKILTLQIIREHMKIAIEAREDVDSILNSKSNDGTGTRGTLTAAFLVSPPAATSDKDTTPKTTSNTTSKTCKYCKGTHFSDKCKKYETAATRVLQLPENACYSCLKPGHSHKKCRSKIECYYCKKRGHHQSLCPQQFGSYADVVKEIRERNEKKPEESLSDTTAPKTDKKDVVALSGNNGRSYTIARARIENLITGETADVRIFLDSGSGQSYVTNRVAKMLKLAPITEQFVNFQCFLDVRVEAVKSTTVQFRILSDYDPNFNLTVLAGTVPLIVDEINTVDVNEFRKEYPQYTDRTFVDTMEGEPIDVLIGSDYFWSAFTDDPKILVAPNLHLVHTFFGWSISGVFPDTPSNSSVVMFSATDAMKRLTSLEVLGISDRNNSRSEEETLALEQFKENITFVETEKRYEISWPWRFTPPDNLPTNFALAKGCLSSLIKRHDSKYLTACNEILQKQLTSGIIELVPNPKPSEHTHYLPFHFVIDENKSTPIRIVYNASAKTNKKYNSLNDCLYKGTNSNTDLLGILLRFRFGDTAIISDIEKAYHQILLKDNERDYLRFLWISNVDQPNVDNQIITYRFRRIPFGVISSSFGLEQTIQFHLKKYDTPITKIIQENIYVDNIIATVPKSEANEFFETARSIFKDASMNLRLWQSNNKLLLQTIPPKLRAPNNSVNVLGIQWESETDQISCTGPKQDAPSQQTTMREVLCLSSQLFDPYGLFCPISIRARNLLRSLHRRNASWTTVLNETEFYGWQQVYEDLKNVPTVKLNRCISEQPSSKLNAQLHVFCDASKIAYAAAVYVRTQNENSTSVNLVFAKSRVAPIDRDDDTTIPRLELLAATLGSQILETIRNALNLIETSPAILWTDSKCVYYWIQTQKSSSVFVTNRIRTIRSVDQLEFRFVPGTQNPADIPSRGTTLEQLQHDEIWWHAPKWLQLSSEQWPPTIEQTLPLPNLPEFTESPPVLTIRTLPKENPLNIDITKFNSYKKLIIVTALCIRFIRHIRFIKLQPIVKRLFPNDTKPSYDYAILAWIKNEQQQNFAEVFRDLKNKKKNKFIRDLRLRTDEDELIRVYSRYGPYENTAPILLPKPSKSRFTFLLITHLHSSLKHAGIETTLTSFNANFWISNGRTEIRKVLTKCRPCQREIAKPYQQPTTSDLPPFRMDSTQFPFTNVGIDICGPFSILQQKKWILITTCLVTRGICLEDLDCLETTHIEHALRRTYARHTKPRTYVSDNMPQFLAIRDMVCAADNCITWKLIPAFSPWQGGAYEKLIGLTKTAFYRCFRDVVFLGPVQFRTTLAEIENAINSRPLTYNTAEPVITPITPNDILRVKYIIPPDNDPIPVQASAARKQLQLTCKYIDETINQFWLRWKTEYLQFLRNRSAHQQQFKKRTNPKVPKEKDIVIVAEPNQKRSRWKLGVVTELLTSSDSCIRAAKVKIATGNTIIRPVQDLYHLELNEEEDQLSEEENQLSETESEDDEVISIQLDDDF